MSYSQSHLTPLGLSLVWDSTDISNLLKPALARGELKTIAATTWSEYKKYFEKDAALSRRFQLVKVSEPNAAEATIILRGLSAVYEQSHGVLIDDDALQAAATLSERYLSGRQLPDKAIDVLDVHDIAVTLNADNRALRSHWFVRENGTLLESSRGLSGIDEIKQLFGAKTLTVDTGADNAAGKLTFNIDGLARAIAPLRDACHWAGE